MADYLQVFANRRIAAMLVLGCASGLPLALSSGTLQAWLTVEGIGVRTIGFFALAGLPYTFKFFWAPLVDALRIPLLTRLLGRRRSWLVLSQFLLIAAISVLALTHGILPPTATLVTPDDACDLDYVPGAARSAAGLEAVMSNSLGFGGHNASLVFRRYEPAK